MTKYSPAWYQKYKDVIKKARDKYRIRLREEAKKNRDINREIRLLNKIDL
jgi:hypothetical protein